MLLQPTSPPLRYRLNTEDTSFCCMLLSAAQWLLDLQFDCTPGTTKLEGWQLAVTRDPLTSVHGNRRDAEDGRRTGTHHEGLNNSSAQKQLGAEARDAESEWFH